MTGRIKRLLFLVSLLLAASAGHAQQDLLDAINTDDNESGITFITEELACFSRTGFSKSLMLIDRTNGRWGNVRTAPFSGQWDDEQPRYDRENNRLFFSSTRPHNADGAPLDRNDIWYVAFENNEFGKPVHVGGGYSTSGIDSGAFYYKGSIYFHSDREGSGIKDVDIYRGDPQGQEFSKLSLNSDQVDGEPFVFGTQTPTIIYMSAANAISAASDIFISQLRDGDWSEPKSIDTHSGLVNTYEWEYAPSLSPDREWLYFTRLVDGQADIFAAKVSELGASSIISNADRP